MVIRTLNTLIVRDFSDVEPSMIPPKFPQMPVVVERCIFNYGVGRVFSKKWNPQFRIPVVLHNPYFYIPEYENKHRPAPHKL